jgi:PAS domain S-box-containing protein
VKQYLESQLFLAAIVESSDDAIISKDLDGIVTSWNRSAERVFGYTAEEMIGNPISVIAAPDRADEMPAILARIRRGERVDHFETKRRRKDGRIIDISLTVSPIRGYDGIVIGASKIARDISDRKLAEQAIADHAERLARSNADLQQFAYIVSHDLQEPLRTISTLTELLRMRYHGKLDSQADELIDSVVGSALRMSDLIRDVLSYSRAINEAPAPLHAVDVGTLIEWTEQNLQSAIRETGTEIVAANLPIIRADAAALAQVLQNLIGNAIKYRSERPPRVRIGAEHVDSEWLFSVADNGIGIPPEFHRNIFKLFKRLHGAEYEGTGIGLAVCKRLIERHGGRIWVESQPGEGSTFRFTVPVKE